MKVKVAILITQEETPVTSNDVKKILSVVKNSVRNPEWINTWNGAETSFTTFRNDQARQLLKQRKNYEETLLDEFQQIIIFHKRGGTFARAELDQLDSNYLVGCYCPKEIPLFK